VRENWRGGSFTGDTEGYVGEGSGDGQLFPLGQNFFYQEQFYEKIERHSKGGSGNGQLSP